VSQLTLWVAPHSRRWYPEGAHCTDALDADIILVRHVTHLATGISVGQSIIATLDERELEGFTWNDHVAFIRRARGGERFYQGETRSTAGRLIVSEMGPRGHEYRPLEDYVDKLYCVVTFDVAEEIRLRVGGADDRCRHVRYGFLQYPPIALNGLTGAHVDLSYGSSMICSTEVTICALNLYVFPDRPPVAVLPAHWSLWTGAKVIDGVPIAA
jgi:hypothetical protein